LTAVRAAAALCAAQVSGDTLGSTCLDFAQDAAVVARNYVLDVSLAREGGSAGAVMLVLQTILLPLALVPGDSGVELYGGTHMAWSPPFDYVRDVWLPALSGLASKPLSSSQTGGWYPVGKGEVRAPHCQLMKSVRPLVGVSPKLGLRAYVSQDISIVVTQQSTSPSTERAARCEPARCRLESDLTWINVTRPGSGSHEFGSRHLSRG
jgi:RNA 3'-terminal phosphate cyclase